VIPDPANTGNTFTSNWGYDNADQFDADAQTLTMHRTTSFTPDTVDRGASDDLLAVGFELEYGGYPWQWRRTRLGWNFGFGFVPISASRRVAMTGTAQRTAYTFNTHSSFFPEAGYQGQPGGEGFNLDSEIVSEQLEDAPGDVSLEGKHTLDVVLYAFRLGPSLFWDLNPSVGLSVGAGPALGFISGDYEFNETIDLGDAGDARNRGNFGATDFVYGGYVNATVTYHAALNGDFYLSAQYMPLGTADFSKNGRSAKLDLSGAVYLSAGINWPF
jgi:hypothetical protein